MALTKEEEADVMKEYREARAELAADLQLLSMLKAANDFTVELAQKRFIQSRGRYENAVHALERSQRA